MSFRRIPKESIVYDCVEQSTIATVKQLLVFLHIKLKNTFPDIK